jgi:putative membrane protein
MDVSGLPTVNATLNGISAVLLAAGYIAVRNHKITAHKAFMGSATGTSSLFLISYLTYHYYAGSKHFEGEGLFRVFYLSVLLIHVLLSMALVPLVGKTLWHATRNELEKHKKIARYAFPVWMTVSVTGVMVYWMLYQL